VNLQLTIEGEVYLADIAQPIDLSLSTGPGGDNPGAFFIDAAQFEPIRVGGFVGSVAEGGSANCEVLRFCAHGNTTHTECIGHITQSRVVLSDVLKQFWFTAQLVTAEIVSGRYVSLGEVKSWRLNQVDALIVRSLPNQIDKKQRQWSGNEPPYFEPEALSFLRDAGIQHLLTDLPSVDPEVDEGRLSAHHEWWGLTQRLVGGVVDSIDVLHPRLNATITELIYVPEHISDGLYALNLQCPNLQTDAVPSRPVIYRLMPSAHR
jgi:arylformamidase